MLETGKRTRATIIGLGFLVAANAAIADLSIDIQGTPGSGIVSMTISGSGTWESTQTDDVILYNAVDGAFAGPGLAIGSGDLNPNDSDWISLDSTFTLDNNGVPVVFDRIYIQDEGGLMDDDISLGTSSGDFTSTVDTAWSIPETTVTFNLSLLGDPDSGATFDDLGLGEHPAIIYSQAHQTGNLTLTVSAGGPVEAVPVNSPLALLVLALGVMLFGAAVFRKVRS